MKALSFVDAASPIDEPSSRLLANLPCALPAVEYLEWGKHMYKVGRKDDGSVFAVPTTPPRPKRYGPRSLWVDETILDHFGDLTRFWY